MSMSGAGQGGELATLSPVPPGPQGLVSELVMPGDEFVDGSQAGEMSPPPIGELFVDPTCPESLAPWLLLLDANALFVIHMTGPETSYRTMANPHGKIPTWIDADGSCMWESNAGVYMHYRSIPNEIRIKTSK